MFLTVYGTSMFPSSAGSFVGDFFAVDLIVDQLSLS